MSSWKFRLPDEGVVWKKGQNKLDYSKEARAGRIIQRHNPRIPKAMAEMNYTVSPIGHIMNPELESGFGGRWIISSWGTTRSARGLIGIFGPPPPTCLMRTRLFPMVEDIQLSSGAVESLERCYCGACDLMLWNFSVRSVHYQKIKEVKRIHS